MKLKTCLIPMMLLLYSCSQDAPSSSEQSDILSSVDEANLIDKVIVSISETDAVKMASRFVELGGACKSRLGNNADIRVTEVKDSVTGKSLVYIVNRGIDEGFMVISATKAESPVLVFNETGRFDPENDYVTKGYLDEYIGIISSITENQIDSLRRVHAAEWSVFEKNSETHESRASSADIESIIAEQIRKKQAQGYTYIGKLHDAKNYLNSEDYQNLVMDISQHSDANYDYEYMS